MQPANYDTQGTIFNIQRFSVHDGNGIRTIPFFKGCPLSCKWCSNPESRDPKPQLLFIKQNCNECGDCIEVCEPKALSFDNPNFIDRDKCTTCGKCAEVCLPKALEMKGCKTTVGDVMKELQKDATIYRRSDGGITLSGGEPLLQPEFALELLKACKEKGWHTAMETTGAASKKTIEMVMPFVDLALTDIKAMDPGVHLVATGVSNKVILENLILISEITKTEVRLPLIPDVNSDKQSVKAVCEFVKKMHNVDTIHLLPYHTYGEGKYDLLGMEYTMPKDAKMTTEDVEALQAMVQDMGYHCHIGG